MSKVTITIDLDKIKEESGAVSTLSHADILRNFADDISKDISDHCENVKETVNKTVSDSLFDFTDSLLKPLTKIQDNFQSSILDCVKPLKKIGKKIEYYERLLGHEETSLADELTIYEALELLEAKAKKLLAHLGSIFFGRLSKKNYLENFSRFNIFLILLIRKTKGFFTEPPDFQKRLQGVYPIHIQFQHSS